MLHYELRKQPINNPDPKSIEVLKYELFKVKTPALREEAKKLNREDPTHYHWVFPNYNATLKKGK